jgi:hypothetical protein
METIIKNPNQPHNGRTMAGIIIAIIGGILLINQFDLFFIPGWLFSWPMLIIAYGLYMGGKYNFKKQIWIWMTVLGFSLLLTDNLQDAGRFVWPMAIIGIGTWMVLKHSKKAENAQYKESSFKEL